jgi:ATP-dependent Lon protease
VLTQIIENYTRESGVRDFDRQIASVMRRIAKYVATGEKYNKTLKQSEVEGVLGTAKFDKESIFNTTVPGVVVGLAWTPVGGDILFIETSLSKGKGTLQLTGNLGDVMKESASTAFTFIKSHMQTS